MPATSHLLSLADPKIAAMPTLDCGEQLVPLNGMHPRLSVDDSAANIACVGYVPTFVARETVARRLITAATNLPSGFRLLIKESLRPGSLQTFYFERRLSRISAENPALTELEAIALTAQFVAPPLVAGHPTGGAIDVTLSDCEGNELDLGCGYDEDAAASKGACFSGCAGLDAVATANRLVLFRALEEVGFVNYPFEWWHWSYGDRYWAVVQHQPHAIYGPVNDATSERTAGPFISGVG